jgi:DNA-binding response OmpR family regulator
MQDMGGDTPAPSAPTYSQVLYKRITTSKRLASHLKRGCSFVGVEHDDATILYAGELEVRLSDGLVLAAGRALTLSVREFELLVAMVRRAGTILTRGELYGSVWGGELRAGDRSVDVYISKLRGNLETAMPDRRFIHTHPGFGYRFQPQPVGPTAVLSQDVHNGQLLD